MSELTSTLIYLPLDPVKSQIRLIHIQPRFGSDSDTIVCSLQLADLDVETCVYNALSYEWGVEGNSFCSIILNGEETPVRENLWRALRTLGDERSTGPIWIDALCINQKDDVERSSQVSQMGRIYQRASCVIAWLG
ncbi:HET-domain-containing protein, partial [Cadophora sp. DSE1049]